MHSDNPRGTRCQALATNGGQWCYMHDPARAGERHRNATRGGRSGSRGRPQSELSKLRDENAAIRDRLLEGDLQPGVAAVAMQSLNCDVRVVLAILKAKEQEELISRLELFEEQLKERQGEGHDQLGA